MDYVELDRSLERNTRRLLQTAWRHKVVFVVVTTVVSVSAEVGILSLTPVYEASTLLITGQTTMQSSAATARQPNESGVSLARVAGSDEVVASAIEKIGLKKLVRNYAAVNIPLFARLRHVLRPNDVLPARTPTSVEIYLPRIQQALTVHGELTSNIIRIAFRSTDPTISADFANAVAQSFVDREVELQSHPGAAEFMRNERVQCGAKAQRAATALQEFSAGAGVYAAQDQQRLLLGRLSELEAGLALTRGSIADRTGQRQALSDVLHKLLPVTRSPYVSSLVDSIGGVSTAHGSDSRIVDDKTTDPPLLLVRVYQDSMAALFKVNADLIGAQNLLKEQLDEEANLHGQLDALLGNKEKYSELKRAVDQANDNFDTYSSRMEEEEFNEAFSAAKFSSVRIIQRATIPVQPLFPRYRVMTILAAVVGLISACGAVLLRNRFDRISP